VKLKYEVNDVKDENAYFDFHKGFRSKIFASSLGSLLGYNKYQSVGMGVLKVCGMLQKEYFDVFYTLRGDLVEYFAYLYLSDFYKNKGLENFTWEFTNDIDFDKYEDNKFFGGKFDIKLNSEKFNIIHEVKSKDVDKFNDFVEDNSEVIQGKLYCVLEKTDRLVMVYGFPNERVVKLLKEWLDSKFNDPKKFNASDFAIKKKITKNDFKFILKPHKVDIDETKGLLNKAYTTVNTCVKNGYIPINWFNSTEINALGLLPF